MLLNKVEILSEQGHVSYQLIDESDSIVVIVAGMGEEGNLKNAILLENAPIMLEALKRINEIVYANNIAVGSKEYFEIRELCCKFNKLK